MDYNIKDALNVLENLKNNPYGIKDRTHVFDRAQKRSIDVNKVTQSLCAEIPVKIEKTLMNHPNLSYYTSIKSI